MIPPSFKHPGRPKASDPRTTAVTVRFSDAEWYALQKRKGTSALSMAAYIRATTLGKKIEVIPAINQLQWAQLSKLAGNLNRSVHLANSGLINNFDTENITELLNEVQFLRRQLISQGANDEK